MGLNNMKKGSNNTLFEKFGNKGIKKKILG
jgi:hypothetical protein